MRIWTLHPKYLDSKGLVALWREALLAQKVLQGKTKGYRHHPQLSRFKQHQRPVAAIAAYLKEIYREAESRGYNFDQKKISRHHAVHPIPVTRGQLLYEWQHLRDKLKVRDTSKFRSTTGILKPEAHPLFTLVQGDIEAWERTEINN